MPCAGCGNPFLRATQEAEPRSGHRKALPPFLHAAMGAVPCAGHSKAPLSSALCRHLSLIRGPTLLPSMPRGQLSLVLCLGASQNFGGLGRWHCVWGQSLYNATYPAPAPNFASLCGCSQDQLHSTWERGIRAL